MNLRRKKDTDDEIREELSEAVELSDESLEKVAGGWTPEEIARLVERYNDACGDTREYYSMNAEDIDRSIFGSLLFK